MAIVAAAVALGAVLAVTVAVTVTGVSVPWRRVDRPDRHGSRIDVGAPPPRLGTAALPALEVLPTGVVVVEPSGAVAFANAAATDLGLCEGAHLTNADMREQALATGRDGMTRDVRYSVIVRWPVRRVVPVALRTVPLDDPAGVALLVTDMTESDRLEAVRRDFVANVGHELKTPVGALSLLAEAVLAAAEDPAEVRRFGERMVHEAQRLGRLVSEVIELSRLQGAEPMPEVSIVDVDHLLREAADRSGWGAHDRDITLVLSEPAALQLTGYEPQLVTALANLIDNAIAYSHVGSRVGVGARRIVDNIEISVSDQGIGIAPRDQERIFERFYRVDTARSRATGGTGLGLAIVKHIVTNHGGSVRLWSEPGAGSTFTLVLPAAAADRMDTDADGQDVRM